MRSADFDGTDAEHFSDNREILEALSVVDSRFLKLLKQNQQLMDQIRRFRNGLPAANGDLIDNLEKIRKDILDDIVECIGSYLDS